MSSKNENKINFITQPNDDKCLNLIEQSFLKNIFSETLTDVQYNGTNFYGQDNEIGRFKLDLNISNDEVFSILKQLANYSLKSFSVQNPILDISFGYFRLSAMHPSLARTKNEKVATFSLRKISPSLKIKANDLRLCPLCIHELLTLFVQCHQSILISGLTGSGKTELQKYLVSKMDEKDRIIIIEDSYETYLKEIYPQRDITTWLVDIYSDLSTLVKTSLRHNPDWIMIAETRGQEAYELVQSILAGHPMITTIHCDSSQSSLQRLVKMFQEKVEFSENRMLSDIANHLKIGIQIEKKYQDQKVIRKITEITEFIPNKEGYESNMLFQYDEFGIPKYGKLSLPFYQKLKKYQPNLENLNIFIPKEG